MLQSRLLRDNVSVVICTHHSSDIECHNDYQVDQNPKGHVIIQSRMQCNDVLVVDYRSILFLCNIHKAAFIRSLLRQGFFRRRIHYTMMVRVNARGEKFYPILRK